MPDVLTVGPDTIPNIDALIAPIDAMTSACTRAAGVLDVVIKSRTWGCLEDDSPRPTTSSTPSSSFNLVAPCSALYTALSNLAIKKKHH